MSRKNEQFKARDKKTHKMTRDGLVEVNQTTGTEQRVSQRGQEFEFKWKAQPGQDAGAFTGTFGEDPRQTIVPAASETQHPDGDMRRPAPPGVPSQPSPAQPDAPVRSAFGNFNAQTAATAAATQDGKRRPKQKQSQAAVHRETDAEGSAAPQHTDTPVRQPVPAHGRGTATDSAAADAAPQTAAELPSRLRFGETEQTPRGQDTSKRQHGTRYQRKFTAKAAKQDEAAPTAERLQAESAAADKRATDGPSPDSPRLQFAADEKPPEALADKLTDSRRKAIRPDTGDARLDKALRRADKKDGKLGKAREKLPTKRRVRMERVYDEKKDKAVRKLRFEKEVKSQRAHLKGALPLRPVKAGANAAIGYGHKKMYQVEHENVGTQAAHKGEVMAEGLARSAYRFHKTRPYRRVARLERAATKAHIKVDYAKALHDNPRLKSNPLSRLMQKQKIKRQYAKAARDARKAASRARKAGDALSRAAGAVAGFVRRHPMLTAGLLILLLLVFIIMTMFSSCSNMAGAGFSAALMSSYLAEDEDIDDAELAYSEWETDLYLQIQNAEADHPGYDEYKYNIGVIAHDPFELMAYLTARYQDFTYADIETELRDIFSEQYTLEFVEEIEVRYRTEYYYDDDGHRQSRQVPYNWYILNVNLTAHSFSDVIASHMNTDEQEMYGLYMETRGNRQYILNPFAFDWLPYISSYYGYRVHPITGERDYHKGIDIAVAAGTEILAGHDGVVTTAGSAGDYGLVVVLNNGDGLVSKYAHCSELLVVAGQEVEKGDVIARVGSTGVSTGPHLHLEVIVNGSYLNPLYFAEGATGGTAPGTPGGPVIPDYSGEPMGDGSLAALLEVAQAQLGKPYVFGSAGPDTFDCSGFVCYVFNQSGVASVGHTTAYGLYSMCTPVSQENARPGDLVFFQGTYSTTSPTSHIGIYLGGGVMIHAGDPVQYENINTSYWQSHLYAYGRLS